MVADSSLLKGELWDKRDHYFFDDDFFGAAEGDTTADDVQVSFDEFGGEAQDGDGETPWEARERRKRRRPCRN